MLKLLKWLDENILSVLAGILILFIPLYPKRPFQDILPGYIVRVRIEDFIVAFCCLLWLIWLIRGKISIRRNPLLKPIIIYLGIGFLSVLSAIFLVHTVPFSAIHIEKIFLHYFRRIEYFSLFFIFYSSVKNFRTLKIYLGIFITAIIGVTIYGFGQKYLYWPAFSTMNREFSKGWMLYLTEHARVLSTFGGHYDLAAYIMMSLVALWSLFFSVRKIIWRIIIFLILSGAFWILILTASRTSFLAYIAGITLSFFLWSYKKGISWAFTRWFIVLMLSIIIMLSFGDLSERFTKLLRIDERMRGIKSLVLSPITAPPKDRAIFLENNPQAALSEITSKSDQPPTPLRPSDVYQDIPLYIPTGTGSASMSAVKRTYSKTAFRYDLSTAIRLDALWPQAIKGFKRNPLLGSGYSTLNKTQFDEFTEAESTDNDYLRNLGETGILGFVTFFGIFFLIIYKIWRNIQIIKDPLLFSLSVGLAGLIFGLLANAVYIDVFESSKVAFSFWSLTGFILAGIEINRKEFKGQIPRPSIPNLGKTIYFLKSKITRFFFSDLFLLLIILSIGFMLRLHKINNPLADWHSWRQADTSSVTRNYVKHGINVLYPTFDDLSNVASGLDNPRGLRFVEFPLYNVASVVVDKFFVGYNLEISGRLTSIFATIGSIIFLFLIVRKYLGRRQALITALVYSVLPYNIFFTRVILPEPFLVFISLGMLYFFDKWIGYQGNWKLEIACLPARQGNWKSLSINIVLFVLSLTFTASALLIKPFAAFLFLPMIYLWLNAFGYRVKSIMGMCLYFTLGMLPFILWRWWISHFPEGVPASLWLLNGDGIRFKGAFFYWIFAERLGKIILGYWGLVFLVLGILGRFKKAASFFYLWGFSMLLYVTVVATGNVRHDYYQTLTIPIISIFLGNGIVFLIENSKVFVSKYIVYITIPVIFVLMEMMGWYYVRDLFNINHMEIVDAGRAVETKTKENSLVVAPYNGDTAFLYQTHRAGWPIMQGTIDDMIKLGAHYYVSVNYNDLTNNLKHIAQSNDPAKRRFKIIDETTDKYIIIQLVPDRDLPK